MENKNTIIAVVLMLIVWVGFSILFPPQPPPAPPVTPEAAKVTSPSTAPGPAVTTPDSPSITAPVPTVAGSERQIVVDHPLYRAVFTNIGGRLIRFELKEYQASPQADAPAVNLVPGSPRQGTLTAVGSAGLDIPVDTYYNVSLEEDILRLDEGKEASLVFTTTLASGLTVEKRYTFQGDGYPFTLDMAVRNGGSTPKSGSLSLALLAPQLEGQETNDYDFVGATTFTGGEVERVPVGDMEKEIVYSQAVTWTAFGDKYFLSAIVPQADQIGQVRVGQTGTVAHNIVQSTERTLAPGDTVQTSYLLYFGPRDLEILKQVGYHLGEAVDFGFFSFIARPLLQVLKFFHGFLGNYGLAIILLTVIIKLLFWPLTQKSYSSMKEMQKLQPEMQKIREKYGKDRDRLNREIMEMYKKHRVNPLGGCLPMVVQIPVFFALYKVLMEAIEVRHAPFYLWINDLSAKDPYYITPLIMGATMFVQQKMTPTTMDPMQAKLFMLMPIIFTFMFLNFPSGLVLYWLINNVLTIGQQYMINRRA